MSGSELTSRAVTSPPTEKNAFRVWIEKHLKSHFRDLKAIYNKSITSNYFELIKDGNESNEKGNVKFIIDGDYLIMQAHDGSDWISTGWTLKLV